ncbi:MAG: amidohydrolase family protein [Phycisphaera sp.]|nr:amidohydrolase family protein [Phycisphaera sp.]
MAHGAAALGAMTLAGCATTARRGGAAYPGYVDAHSHIWTPDTERFPLGPWITKAEMDPASFTAEQLLAVAEPAGVQRVVIIQHAPYYGDNNAYLLDCCKRYPGRFSVVAIVEERRNDLADHLRALKRQGVRGVRIGPTRYADRSMVADPMNWLNAPTMRRLWTLATDLDLVLCPLIGAEFLPTLEPMLADFPRTTIAIDHFGHAHADRPDELRALTQLARHERVHVKVSAFYKFGDRKPPYDDVAPLIHAVADAFGPRRMLWGSDCPYQLLNGNNYADAVALVESGLDFLDAPARDAILRDTAARLFFS